MADIFTGNPSQKMKSLLLTGFLALSLLPGTVFTAEPRRDLVIQGIMLMEWKSISAVRSRAFADWRTIDSATRILKFGPDSAVAAGLAAAEADLAQAKTSLAAKTAAMEAKLTAEELKSFKEEQKQESALVEVLQALEVLRKEKGPDAGDAAALRAKAQALVATLKPLRAQLSAGLGGVPVPAEIEAAHP